MSHKGEVLVATALLCLCLFSSGCALVQAYPPGPVTNEFNTACIERSSPPVCHTKQTTAQPNDPPRQTTEQPKDPLAVALDNCAIPTRTAFGNFLQCREDAQEIAGGAIVALAAAASGIATAGISSVAAVSLGSSAGFGLGLDYILYNKDKTKAYSDGLVRLQCVIGDSEPLRNKLADLPDVRGDASYQGLQNSLQETRLCLENQHKDTSRVNLVAARYRITVERAATARDRLNALPGAVDGVVETIDVSAFAASQAGVPDADRIKTAAQSTSLFTSSGTKAAAAPGAPTKHAPEAVAPSACSEDLNIGIATQTTLTLNEKLASIKVPDLSFSDCLAEKAFDETASSDNSSTKKSGSGGKPKKGKGGKSGSGSANSSTDGSSNDNSSSNGSSDSSTNPDSTPAKKPDKIAFQVLPSDMISVKKDESKTVHVLGGTAPYYAIAVDPGVSIDQATQTDLFVSYEIKLDDGKGEHRVLVADQAGAEEVIYVSEAPEKPSTVRPKPSKPAKPRKPAKPKPAAYPPSP